jgi:sulfur-carrier protein
MAIRILYFAGLRETLGAGAEDLAAAPQLATVADLRAHLMRRGEPWQALSAARNVHVAVNQRLAEPHTAIEDGDEVAFFPPVTGG